MSSAPDVGRPTPRWRPAAFDAQTWLRRLHQVHDALDRPHQRPDTARRGRDTLARQIESTIDLSDAAQVWLTLTVLSGVVADHREVLTVMREARVTGGQAVVSGLHQRRHGPTPSGRVRIAVGQTLVDVTQIVRTELVTGIQRVALQTVRAWDAHHEIVPVVWTAGAHALRGLTADERARLGPAGHGGRHDDPGPVVPWRSTLLLPEVPDDDERIRRLDGLLRHSGCRTGAIGYDCVPFTSPETVQEGFAPVFFGHLGAMGRTGRIAAISSSAAQEYTGWRQSLSVLGLAGPDIRTVELPEVAIGVGEGAIDEARALLTGDERSLVLVVGSHEPRKNHLAVLHAAELCWRSGNEFTLAMVGGNAWSHEDFDRQVGTLQRRGRPLRVVSRLPDRLLGAAYRIARFTVFPSLNEGFGLPVAESLAAGTPAITSNFGSMRDIASRGGAVLVDPRDPRDIAAAMTRLLRDDIELERLRASARSRPHRSWAHYAEEVWEVLVMGSEPVPGPSTPGSTR